MKVLFVVTGFGYGDAIRADAVINELKNEAEFMILGYDHSYEYFKDKFPTLEFRGYSLQEDTLELKTHRFFIKNFYLPASWLLTLRRYKEKIRKFNPDIIVSDFEPLANLIAKTFNKKLVSIFAYDPQKYKRYNKKNKKLDIEARFIASIYKNSDLVIIPSFFKSKNYNNIIYVNPIIKNTNKISKESLMNKLGLKREPILVMLGGSNFGFNLGKKIAELYERFDEEFIIFGAYKQLPSYHFAEFKNNFLDYLKVSKAVITLAGNLTLSECLFFKKPMLIFPIKNHIEQLLNAYSLRNVAMVKYSIDDLYKTIKKFLEDKDKIKKKIDKLDVKADGAKQVKEILINLV